MCNPARDFPPYPDADPGSQIRHDLAREDATAPMAPARGAGWPNEATFIAYSWLRDDLMLWRLFRARMREPWVIRHAANAGAISRTVFREYGGPLAFREVDAAGGQSVVDWKMVGAALLGVLEAEDAESGR